MLISTYYYCIWNFYLVYFIKFLPRQKRKRKNILHNKMTKAASPERHFNWSPRLFTCELKRGQKMFQLLIMLWLCLCMFGESINSLVSAIHQILMQQSAFVIFHHCSRAMQLLFQDLNFFT